MTTPSDVWEEIKANFFAGGFCLPARKSGPVPGVSPDTHPQTLSRIPGKAPTPSYFEQLFRSSGESGGLKGELYHSLRQQKKFFCVMEYAKGCLIQKCRQRGDIAVFDADDSELPNRPDCPDVVIELKHWSAFQGMPATLAERAEDDLAKWLFSKLPVHSPQVPQAMYIGFYTELLMSKPAINTEFSFLNSYAHAKSKINSTAMCNEILFDCFYNSLNSLLPKGLHYEYACIDQAVTIKTGGPSGPQKGILHAFAVWPDWLAPDTKAGV